MESLDQTAPPVDGNIDDMVSRVAEQLDVADPGTIAEARAWLASPIDHTAA
ncbi:MAG TPA: hypothetical protein VNU19_00830 [Candidatus Acidoferrum sp.]|jgi:hypothetical protein|nr:hypothetical protein [Candidatus Acidoferrum sp.]